MTPGLRARLPLIAEAGAVVFTLMLRYWVIRDRYIYAGVHDEASPLAIARTLSGSRDFHLVGLSFDAGYGILLSPIYAVVDDPELAFRLVLMTNVMLAGVTLVALRMLLIRLFDASGPIAVWSAAIALAMPGAAIHTAYSGSEVLVVLMVVVTLLMAAMLGDRPGWMPAIGLAAVGGSLVLVHSRLSAGVVAVLVILVVSALRRDISLVVAGVAVIVLAAMTWGALQLNAHVHDVVWLPSAQTSDRLGVLLDRLSLDAGMTAAGMAWHQMVVTFGLAVVGIGYLVATSVHRAGRPLIGPGEWQRWKLLLILAAMAVPSAVFMTNSSLAVYMVHGRYWDALAVPIVAIGACYLLRASRQRANQVLSGTVLVVLVTSIGFFLVRQDDITAAFLERGLGGPRRIPGLMAFLERSSSISIANISAAALGVMAAVLAVAVLSRRHHRVIAAAMLVGVASAATIRASIHTNEILSYHTRWRPTMELVEDGILPADATVAFKLDSTTYSRPIVPFTAYQFYQPQVDFVGLEGAAALDYQWVVSNDEDPMLRDRGWEIVFEHPNNAGVVLWERP